MKIPWRSNTCEQFRDAFDLVVRSRSGIDSDRKLVIPSFFEFGYGYAPVLTDPWNVYNGFFTCMMV